MYQGNSHKGGVFAVPQGWKNSHYASQFKLLINFFFSLNSCYRAAICNGRIWMSLIGMPRISMYVQLEEHRSFSRHSKQKTKCKPLNYAPEKSRLLILLLKGSR